MPMKRFMPITHLMFLLGLVAAWPVSIPATSYLPQDMLKETQTEPAVLQTAAVLSLFYAAANGKIAAIEVGSIIPVYRENNICKTLEVGKIRIIGMQREFFISAVIIEGNLQLGDIAQKNGFAAIIVPTNPCGRRQAAP